MPTSWTFVPLQEKVYVFRNGKRIVMSSGNHDILPDVCEVEVISESDVLRSKIKWKKEDGVRVVFSDQKKVVLKVCDFIWNDNEFSRQFKDVTTAESFVSTFEKRTYISASEMETQEPLYMAEIVDLIPDTPVPFNKQTSLTSSKRKTLIPVLMSPVEPAIKKTNSLEEKMLDGLYQIELKQISEAPENIRLRDIDSDFVDQIKTEMELSGNIATQPLALCIPNLKEDEFEESNINNYDFICLGGNHLRCAYEKLHKKHAFAKIYVDLTDEECLIVAKFHNEVGHYVKELTNFDMVIHLSCQVKLKIY
ncbi:uncharacterized protein LOC134684788 [Mytilus trossulus]|uniref:uncharacterized protein LOC134684788 n=1 Tax=Mytilus trossulus TaxID=6551 RepID=UPI003006F779